MPSTSSSHSFCGAVNPNITTRTISYTTVPCSTVVVVPGSAVCGPEVSVLLESSFQRGHEIGIKIKKKEEKVEEDGQEDRGRVFPAMNPLPAIVSCGYTFTV